MKLTFQKRDLIDEAKYKPIEEIDILDFVIHAALNATLAICAAADYIEYENDTHIKIIKCRTGEAINTIRTK